MRSPGTGCVPHRSSICRTATPAPGPKFDYKLRWFERLTLHAKTLLASGVPVVLAGDCRRDRQASSGAFPPAQRPGQELQRSPATSRKNSTTIVAKNRDRDVTVPSASVLATPEPCRVAWGAAMICAKAALASLDPHMRAILVCLAEFWLELALHDTSKIGESAAIDVAMIERMQAQNLGEFTALH